MSKSDVIFVPFFPSLVWAAALLGSFELQSTHKWLKSCMARRTDVPKVGFITPYFNCPNTASHKGEETGKLLVFKIKDKLF